MKIWKISYGVFSVSYCQLYNKGSFITSNDINKIRRLERGLLVGEAVENTYTTKGFLFILFQKDEKVSIFPCFSLHLN